jgi:phosphinothricin acetyltransferase
VTVPTAQIQIRALESDDWPQVADIYAAGIATGNATFETAPPRWEEWDASHRHNLRFVATDGAKIVGWVAAGGVSDRCCYGGVIEHSVYVHPTHQGHGIGRLLLTALIDAAEGTGVWTIQTGIFPENSASIALHHACDFRTVGRRERLGQLNGTWRDVLLLEYRRTEPVAEPSPDRRVIPIACTLEEHQAESRLDEWRLTLTPLVASVERPEPRRLRLTLRADPAGIAKLVGLAQAEKVCCPFFNFTLDVDSETVALVVEVPADAETVLDDFARLAGTTWER